MSSEFGKGFIYNLILFSKHWLMFEDSLKKELVDYSLWFNAASDHFYELEVPEQWQKKKICKLAKWLQDRILYLGHGFKEKATKKDYQEVFAKIEELSLLIDKELGLKPCKADYS